MSATPSTRRIERVRRSTTRSGVTVSGSRVCRTAPPLRWLPVRFLERRGSTSASVLALYVLISFAYWGARLFPHPGRFYIGTATDPQIFIWSFAWWPHALGHALNPFQASAVWAPQGLNLAWTATSPGLAIAFTPLTLLTGPVASYDVAAFLMPALAAWTAFLLCRYLTRSLWASLVGGYLFGFSSYMAGQIDGHLHMTSVFLLPLIALVVIRYVEYDLDGWNLAIRLGPMLALQLTFSTENAFSITLALAVGIVLAFLFVSSARRRLVALLKPLVGSYAFGFVLASPLLYYALKGFQSGSVNQPTSYTTDLLNLVVPTPHLLGGERLAHIASHFPGNDSERDGYLGIPPLVMFVLYAVRRWRRPGGRLLLAGFVIALIATFGVWLQVDGHKIVPLPWEHIGYLPLFDNVLPSRLMLFVSLIVAIAVALWTSSSTSVLRIALPVLAVLSFIPNPHFASWKTAAYVPEFFRGQAVRSCVPSDSTALIFPQTKHGNGMLWQAVSSFRFRLADGYLTPDTPTSYYTSPAIARIANREVTWRDLQPFARTEHVKTFLVDAREPEPYRTILGPLGPPHVVGGVLVYHFGGEARC
jgi:hypothetical protein